MAVNRTKVLEAAQKFLSKGQYDKAIAEYQKLVAEDPRDVRTLLKIGDLHTRRNKPKDAIDVYQKVAELYAKQGFFLKAVAVYKQILKLDAAHIDSSQKLAKMYEELALTSDALSTYEQVADAYMAQGLVPKALETMQRMVELDGQNVAARIKYAEALSKAEKPREAAKAFSEGAQLLKEQGRMDDYIRVVERQLYHDAENLNIARELSSLYLERSDPKRALAKLQVCFKADPRDIQTLEMLAEAFRQLGQIPKTISVLKEIARLHGEVNATEPRRRTLKRILDLDPNEAEAKQALASLGGAQTTPQRTSPGASVPQPPARAGSQASAKASQPQARPAAISSDFPPVPEPDEVDMEMDDELGTSDTEDVLILDDHPAPVQRKYEPAQAPRERPAPTPAPQQVTRSSVANAPAARPSTQGDAQPRRTGADAPRPGQTTSRTSAVLEQQAAAPAPASASRSSVSDAQRAPVQPTRTQSQAQAPQETARDRIARLVRDADEQESAGRYDAAESSLKQVLTIDPEHLPTHERLKDLFLATDRRVDAVRELLWLSDAWTERNLDRSVQYAKAAFDLAPNAAATKNRLRALGVDPDREKQEEVMFVEDSHASSVASEGDEQDHSGLDAIMPPVREASPPSGERSERGSRPMAAAQEDPLDIPLSPDDFDDVPPPAARGTLRSDSLVAALLERPITPEEFELEGEPEQASAAAEERPYEADMQDLLDAPISPDEFDAPPPKRDSTPRADVDALLDQPLPPDDFGLSDERFDRSGLIDVESPAAAQSVAPAKAEAAKPTAAEVIVDDDDEPSIEFAEIGTGEIDIDTNDEDDFDAEVRPSAPPTMPPPGRAGRTEPAVTAFAKKAPSLANEASFGDLEGREKPAAAAPTRVPPFGEKFPGAPVPAPLPKAAAPEARPKSAPELLRDETDFSDLAFDAEPGPDSTIPGAPIPELVRQSAREEPEDLLRKAPVEAPKPKVVPVSAKAEAPAAAAKAEAPETLPPEVEEALDEADFFASQGMMEEALEVVQEAILIYPSVRALKQRLAEYEAKADEQDAKADAQSLELTEDDSFDIAEQLAHDLADVPASGGGAEEMVDVESVFAQFKKGVAAQISVDDSDTHFDLGIAYKEMGLVDDAMQEFETAARSPERACTALTMIGMCCLEKGDAKKAIEHFERALSSQAKQPAEELALVYEIGNAHEILGQLDRAVAAFEKVLAKDRSFRGVASRLDQLKKRAGKTAGALG